MECWIEVYATTQNSLGLYWLPLLSCLCLAFLLRLLTQQSECFYQSPNASQKLGCSIEKSESDCIYTFAQNSFGVPCIFPSVEPQILTAVYLVFSGFLITCSHLFFKPKDFILNKLTIWVLWKPVSKPATSRHSASDSLRIRDTPKRTGPPGPYHHSTLFIHSKLTCWCFSSV